jgi:hypothetical protein
MADEEPTNGRSRALRPLAGFGSRAASATLRPFTDAAGVALSVGMSLERRAVDRALDSPELERLVGTALDSPRIQAAVKRVLASDGAKQLITSFFDSGLLDEFVDRLLESRALWRLVDEVADSPAVTAAITQQSLGFADQVGEEIRARSRNADDWLERAARRLARRRPDTPSPNDGGPQHGGP